jgi:hypothetical protein
MISLLLLPAFFLLHNYNELFGFIPVKQIVKDAIIIYSLIFVSFFILRLFKISFLKSTLILFFLSFFSLLFGPFHGLVKIITSKSIFSSYKIFLPLCVILLVVAIRKIVVASVINTKNIVFLNIVMICLVAGEIILIAANGFELKKTHNLIYPYKVLCEKYVSKKLPDSSKPDIYFLVFDEYTNNKMLKKLWSFNNDSITNWLSSIDFYVPGNTKSNYTFTSYSISSTFNMDYIRDVKKSVDATIPLNILQSIRSLSDNETFCILKKENYKIRFLAPFSSTIEKNKIEHYFDDLITDQIYRQTLPGSIKADLLWNFETGKLAVNADTADQYGYLTQKFKSIQYTIDEIKSVVNNEENRKPQFIYGHFLITHGPHIFDSSGRFFPDKINPGNPKFNTYPPQVMYANKVMKELVTYIRLHTKPNTIIIVEGDHGFRQIHGSDPSIYFPNFFAAYFPDKNYSMLYDSITPINVFRTVFNKFFYKAFPLLKDSGIVVKEN